jgi:hypothetical protein
MGLPIQSRKLNHFFSRNLVKIIALARRRRFMCGL